MEWDSSFGLTKVTQSPGTSSGISRRALWAGSQLRVKPLALNLSRNPGSWEALPSRFLEENRTKSPNGSGLSPGPITCCSLH